MGGVGSGGGSVDSRGGGKGGGDELGVDECYIGVRVGTASQWRKSGHDAWAPLFFCHESESWGLWENDRREDNAADDSLSVVLEEFNAPPDRIHDLARRGQAQPR